MRSRRLTTALILAVLGTGVGGGTLWAQESGFVTTEQFSFAIDMVWVILTAALVFFMQAGFAMVETGLTRSKNATNILMKNLLDFCIGAIAYWAVGWAFMYGRDVAGIIGETGFFLSYGPEGVTGVGLSGTLPAGTTAQDPMAMNLVFRNWMFQVVFAGTAATIMSGAMAERTKFAGYLAVSFFISALIYPVAGHWVWGGGWLSDLGFHDFAGSTVVHSVGGWCALAGAALLGPRIGKYYTDANGTHSRPIPGHNLPLASLGVFILWFGWYGFNAGSTLSGSNASIGLIAVNTTLGAAAGAIAALVISWIWFKKPEPSITLNGALAGLVGITAGCDVVNPLGAIIIGFVAGTIIIFSVEFIDRILHIDDPVGAISVHALGGVWGTVAVGFFADGSVNAQYSGIFYGGGDSLLHAQAVGVGAVMLWSLVMSFALFFLVKISIGLRVKEKQEIQGLDLTEHKSEAYPGFQIFSN